jgi:HEAT repeats
MSALPSRLPRVRSVLLLAFVLITVTTPPSLHAQTASAEENAAKVKIETFLAHSQQDQAIEVYDAFRTSTGRDAAALLALIARSELRRLSQGELSSVRGDALGALAADGDRAARQRLEQMSTPAGASSDPASLAATIALARLSDPKAAERLVSLASEIDPGRRVALLEAIASVPNAPVVSLARELLSSSDPMAQAAAAETAATLNLTQLAPELRKIMTTGQPIVRPAAILALTRFGDAAAKDRARGMLASPAPSVRIQAARVLDQVGDRSWVKDIRPLLKDSDGLTRFYAAELLLATDRSAALEVLQGGLVDPNPAIRGECARILTSAAIPDLATLRTLLTDNAPNVRLLAASAILVQARTAAASATPAPHQQAPAAKAKPKRR